MLNPSWCFRPNCSNPKPPLHWVFFWCVLYLSLECGELRGDGLDWCVFICVCVYNWGRGTLDKTDNPVWAVGGWWRLDVVGVQGSPAECVVTVITRGVGRASCHSASADSGRDVSLRRRPNLNPSSRRQSSNTLPRHLGGSSKKSIQMKVKFISFCFGAFVDLYLANKWARHVLFFKDVRCLWSEQNFKWSSRKVQLHSHVHTTRVRYFNTFRETPGIIVFYLSGKTTSQFGFLPTIRNILELLIKTSTDHISPVLTALHWLPMCLWTDFKI